MTMRTSANNIGWNWECAQLANGLLKVEQDAAPFDAGFIGSVTVDRPCLHHVRADAGREARHAGEQQGATDAG